MTFKEFGEQKLSGDVKARCLQALKDDGNNRGDVEHEGDESSFISCAFCWAGTPQGHEYWNDVYRNIGKKPDFYVMATLDQIIADALALLEKMRKLPYSEYKTMDAGSKVDYDELVVAIQDFVVEVQ